MNPLNLHLLLLTLSRLRRVSLSQLGLLIAVMLLVCGSLAGFALGQMLAHGSAAAALPLEDQRISLTSTAGASSTTSDNGNGSTTGATSGGSGSSGTSSGSSGTTSNGHSPGGTSKPGRSGQSPSTAHSSTGSNGQPAQGNGKSPSGQPGSQGHQGHDGQETSQGGQRSGQDDDSQGNTSGTSVTQTGNGQTITVSNSGSSVTISSNGSGASVSVSQGSGQYGQSSSGAACNATQLRNSWPAVAEPLRTNQALIVPDGGSIPVRFQLQGACAGAATVKAHLYLAPMDGSFIPALPANGNSRSNAFHFDSGSCQYEYNLTTRGLPPGMYQLGIDLGNGQLFVVPFALR